MHTIDEWIIIDKETIKKEVETLAILNYAERRNKIKEMQNALPKSYRLLQEELDDAYQQVINNLTVNQKLTKYNIDLYFGIELFNILENYGFNARNASIDKVWYYISLYVIPDIIFKRFASEKETSSIEDHFWKKSRRIYPKSLWWYIYLSIPNNITTRIDRDSYLKETLKYNTTDTILQIVERTSTFGYRRDLYSEIIKAYSLSRRDANILRKVLVMNTTKTKVIEPALTCGGIKQYVKQLFLSVGEELENYDIT